MTTIDDDEVLEKTLRAFIAYLDYDLYKALECDEETGEDSFPDQVEEFRALYLKFSDN